MHYFSFKLFFFHFPAVYLRYVQKSIAITESFGKLVGVAAVGHSFGWVTDSMFILYIKLVISGLLKQIMILK